MYTTCRVIGAFNCRFSHLSVLGSKRPDGISTGIARPHRQRVLKTKSAHYALNPIHKYLSRITFVICLLTVLSIGCLLTGCLAILPPVFVQQSLETPDVDEYTARIADDERQTLLSLLAIVLGGCLLHYYVLDIMMLYNFCKIMLKMKILLLAIGLLKHLANVLPSKAIRFCLI